MKKPNITPGPWRKESNAANGEQEIGISRSWENGGASICLVDSSRDTRILNADAQAIAALPDLLAALGAALSLLECANDHQREAGRMEYDTQTARDALAKAGYEFP